MNNKSENKICQNCKKDFTIEPDDFGFYEKMKVPLPTWCPTCRDQRRLVWRNERALYKRKCDLCGKMAIARVSPDKHYPMYCQECWWGDKWDPYSFGRDYDFSRPFFEQFKELLLSVPHISIQNAHSVNSEWVNQETDDKNCYLNVGGHYNEDSAYCTYELYGRQCFDSYWLLESEKCSNDINCEKCFNTHYSVDCRDCMDTYLSYDCRNCSNIIGCIGLRSQKYCVFNKQLTKEQYEDFRKNNALSKHSVFEKIKAQAKELWVRSPHRPYFIVQSPDVTGNYIENSAKSHEVFYATAIEDCAYCYVVGWTKDSYDLSAVGKCEMTYECASEGGLYNSIVTTNCLAADPMKAVHSTDIHYSYLMISSNHCFGSACVKNGEYTILNKRYSKEEYEALLPKIKKHMTDMPYKDGKGREYAFGEFFPPEIAPYGYNETAAQDIYPLRKEQAADAGFLWNDYHDATHHTISEKQIPDDSALASDDLVNEIFICTETGKPYKMIPAEISFYRMAGLPLPLISPQRRHEKRMASLFPRKLWKRTCPCIQENHGHAGICGETFNTSYTTDRPEIVYCEPCYQKEIL